MTVSPDRLAATLICAGAIVGLIGSIATLSVLLGVPSFALVLLLGVYVSRRQKEGRLLAGAVVWFAVLGAFEGFYAIFLYRGFVPLPSDYLWKVSITILGMAVAVGGAILKLRPLRA
ncbi:MAG: hypothetical protein E6K02_06145 [Methanobacteriota archaeon]|nr:MAG: hypothetical protein E6K02_06145 [Euryarchaeota archaeon]